MEDVRSEIQGNGSHKTKVRSISGQKNLLVNGGLELWRRGISFTSVSLNQYIAERWFLQSNPGGSPGNVQASRIGGNFSQFAMQINDLNTSGAITVAQKLPVELIQRIKRKGFLTLSMDLRSPTGNAVGAIGIASSDAPGLSAEINVDLEGTFKRFTHVVEIPNFVSNELYVFVKPRAIANETGLIEVDNVMLSTGIFEDGVDFEEMHSSLEEHSRANIYYEEGVFDFEEFINAAGGGQGYGRVISFKDRKRSVPSINFDTPSLQSNVSTFSATKITEDGFLLRVFPTSTGSTELQVKWKADAEL